MLTLTRRTAPLASLTTFSSAGPSCLQGPHQGAQKSTITGTSRDASSTSAAKVSSEESLIWALDGDEAAAPSAFAGDAAVTGGAAGRVSVRDWLSVFGL